MKLKFFQIPALALLVSFSLAAENEPSDTAEQQSLTQPVEATEPMDQSLALLADFQKAFEQRNFELSYIVVRQGQIEPIRIIHGVVDGVGVTHKMYLNGPSNEAVSRDGMVAYFEAGQMPYSLSAARLSGIFHNLAAVDMQRLQENYELVIAGKSRVAGRPAQVIRIVPKSSDLYGMYVFIESNTKLPLRADIVDSSGDLVEQHMAISMVEFEQPNEWMRELATLELPSAVAGKSTKRQNNLQVNWKLGWIPEGMQQLAQERHTLAMLSEPVDYLKLSDGLFEISIYANELGGNSLVREQLVRQGATSLHTSVRKGVEITVVGEIPPEAAAKIADSVQLGPYLK